jgi:DNA polymerase elongation subunit (family B)
MAGPKTPLAIHPKMRRPLQRGDMPRAKMACVQVLNGRKQRFEGPEKVIITDLLEFIKVHDPDRILFPYADTWVPLIVKKARRYGLEPTFSRSGWFKSMTFKSYWSYGKVNHKDGALIPEGRVLIKVEAKFSNARIASPERRDSPPLAFGIVIRSSPFR